MIKHFIIVFLFVYIQLSVIQEISIAEKLRNTSNNQNIGTKTSLSRKQPPNTIKKEPTENKLIDDKKNNCIKPEANSNICKPE